MVDDLKQKANELIVGNTKRILRSKEQELLSIKECGQVHLESF
jgi:hypothetical protein